MNTTIRRSRGAAIAVLACLLAGLIGQEGRAQAPASPASELTSLVASVKSKDGTTIVYEQSGKGPALILVSPALASRAGASALATLLAPSFLVVNFDRRGRGESGDSKKYAVEREIEDIEALVDRAGGSAFLFGSSSGAALALEAANKLGTKIKALVAFEPPFIVDGSRPPVPDDFAARLGTLVSAGRRDDAVAAFMLECIRVPEDMLGMMKQSPMWAGMEKLAHTLPYDVTIVAGLQTGKPLPAKRWTSVTARTLAIDGELSDPFLRTSVQALTEVLPTAKRHTLSGQDHSAMFTAPQSLVPVLVEFFGAETAKPQNAEPGKGR